MLTELDKLVKITIKYTIMKNALKMGWNVINNNDHIIIKKKLLLLSDHEKDFHRLIGKLLIE